MIIAVAAGALVVLVVLVASLPYWLPRLVVAVRSWLFARINGAEGIPIPGDLVDSARFLEVYAHPAARGRSRGAALSDLFWYWLSPGAEVHQEHLEPGPRYDEVAGCTRRILTMPSRDAERLAVDCLAVAALPDRARLVRLRDLVMPVWAEFYHRLVFGRPATDEVRAMIVANADDVVTALKCCGVRHMDRRLRLTTHLERVLDEVPHPLPGLLSRREQAYYLQGTFFNTAVVQSSEATAHVLMALAAQRTDGPANLDHVFDETMARYPLFGIAHRVTTADIEMGEQAVIPAGSVLCFSYPDFHRSGGYIPFGVAANRPCPAWHLAPVTVKAVTRELFARFTCATNAAHTRSIPNRGPCLLAPRRPTAVEAAGTRPTAVEAAGTRAAARRYTLALAYLGLRDRWEDVWRSLVQLVLGTYMVWHARRLRLCARYFEELAVPSARN